MNARFGDKFIMHTNQSSTSIDRQGHSDRDTSLEIRKSGKKMSVDFGWNADDKIGMNPSRTIVIHHTWITSTRQVSFNIFDSIRGMSYLAYKVSP